jgi:hypothetical protein
LTEPTLVGEIVDSRTPEQWAAVVRADLGQAVAGFIAAGQHLIQARMQIEHGWEIWLRDEVGISRPKAQMLMDLARHPVLSDRYHGNGLPPSWRTLYELSQLDAPLLQAAIEQGRVRLNTTPPPPESEAPA